MTVRGILHGLRRIFRRTAAEQELSDETEAAKEAVREAGWDGKLDLLRRDVAYGVRGLRRNPAFTLVAVVTLALGVGANSAMFSVVDAVLLRPLPYRNSDRLALIWTDDVARALHEQETSLPTVLDWRAQSRAFVDVAWFNAHRSTLVAPDGERAHSRGGLVSGNLFAVLGVAPLLGRTITADDEASAAPVTVISYALWQRRFDGDSAVIGKTMNVDDGKEGPRLFTIVGVMPSAFYFPDKATQLWTPATTYWRFARERYDRFGSSSRRWTAIGRLAPGRSIDDARADLARIGDRLARVYRSDVPDFAGFHTSVARMLDHVAGADLRTALWLLLGAVALVLLTACANVANLLLARGTARQRELAIRGALGAGRGHLVRQLVTESMVLASAGALGVLTAWAGVRVVAVAAAGRVPRIDEVTVDGRVLLYSAAI